MGVFPRESHIDIDLSIDLSIINPIPPGVLVHVEKFFSIKLGKRAINKKQSYIKFVQQ